VAYDAYPVSFFNPGLPDHVRDVINALVLEGIHAIADNRVSQPGVWPGSGVLHDADSAIARTWLQTKPDDGVQVSLASISG
jgi:hypothetical protein